MIVNNNSVKLSRCRIAVFNPSRTMKIEVVEIINCSLIEYVKETPSTGVWISNLRNSTSLARPRDGSRSGIRRSENSSMKTVRESLRLRVKSFLRRDESARSRIESGEG